jgi:hypothetical protein
LPGKTYAPSEPDIISAVAARAVKVGHRADLPQELAPTPLPSIEFVLSFARSLNSVIGVLRVGRVITIFALCCAIGLPWMVLQSVAWTTMVIEYSKRAPLRQAITQTFDGMHPCSLCHAVNTGTNSEKKSDLQSPSAKIDMICAARAICLLPPLRPFEFTVTNFSLTERWHSPPVPPPRSLPG